MNWFQAKTSSTHARSDAGVLGEILINICTSLTLDVKIILNDYPQSVGKNTYSIDLTYWFRRERVDIVTVLVEGTVRESCWQASAN